jgi:hypothetical protein
MQKNFNPRYNANKNPKKKSSLRRVYEVDQYNIKFF